MKCCIKELKFKNTGMQIIYRKILLLITLFVLSLRLYATHNRAGEITYEQIGEYKYKITLITYTYTKAPADRPELDIYFGDGTFETVARIEELYLPDDYKRNTYVIEHTYPGPGTFVISMEDPNRNEGVRNIPGSVNIRFALKTILQINPTLGENSTPVMLNPPIDKAAKGLVFIHNPNAFDPDGDSLSFKLAVCLGDGSKPIENYRLPEASVDITVDPITGDLIWNTPVYLGIYNIAMEIEEWRNGVKIGSIIRDMQIEVVETDNKPPKIDPVGPFCVEADSLLQFTVTARDTAIEQITLTSTGGVYQLENSPAVFEEGATAYGIVQGDFNWQTLCEHVRKQPYMVIFKATDDNPDQILFDYQNVPIEVVGPAPENVQLEPTNSAIFVKWDPSRCSQVVGYKIYRKNTKENFVPGDCELGVPDYLGYEHIATIVGHANAEYIDNDNGNGLTHGYLYCYMIVAFYADGAESYASTEVCTELTSGVPIILETSVVTTSKTDGIISLNWLKPFDFDPVANPGPYRYNIYRSDDLWGTGFTDPVYVYGIDNTSYVDTKYNSLEKPRIYKMGLYNYDAVNDTWNIIGVPEKAASPFLILHPRDNEIELEIGENVPWENYRYVIYKQNPISLDFDSIATTDTPNFIDRGLDNGKTYCYKVKTIGKYGLDTIPSPLINYSQEACAVPIDTVPSCAPELTLVNNCDSLRNELVWTNPNNYCADDVIAYNIYYAKSTDMEMELLTTVDNAKDTTYFHYPQDVLAGCYVVTAVDSFQNESAPVNKVCADNCEYYELPNTFSPNGDGINDLFKPISVIFVEKVEMKIYNRWGALVFKTDDPNINWDGTDKTTKQKLQSGVYYYVCDVWEYRLNGLQVRNISGFIQLFAEQASGSD
jgi:gliding motility-associated-like protein